MRPPYDHGWRQPLSKKAGDRLAVAFLIVASMMLGVVWYLASVAGATTSPQRIDQLPDDGQVVTVEVSWHGCAELTAPDTHNPTTTTSAVVCDPPKQPGRFLVHPGDMYGAAIFSPGQPVSCRVIVGERERAYQSALGAVNCLARY